MKKVNLSWDDVTKAATSIAESYFRPYVTETCIKIYGVPRGGIYAAQLLITALGNIGQKAILVETPVEADIFVDDIIDSGKTLHRYQQLYPKVPFYSLMNKKLDPIEWISFPWERMTDDDNPIENVRRLIQYIGDDPTREGLLETPERVIKSFNRLYGGYSQKPEDVLKVFTEGACDEMVLLKNIELYSMCEHHMLPFYGCAHIAYIPNKKVIGISKLARLLEIYSRRLQIQERLCQQVTDALDSVLQPKGSACIIEAKHFCMVARGVEKQNSTMVTSSLTGVFKKSQDTRNELLSLIKS